MGLVWTKISNLLALSNRECRIVMLGLDAAGKTTVLYSLKLGERVVTIPTIGFNVETIQYKKLNFTVWDVGGQDRIRRLWNHYYDGTQGLIFVLDSHDTDRMKEAKQELHAIMSNEEMKRAPVLIFANKQDLDGACKASEVANKLGLNELHGQKWYVQPTCASKGEGLYEGLDWLAEQILHAK
eukprot:TRINITY_DN4065_c0_g1_i2.p1 TRINITY_DN4065_c0_g1~~TRINITY_DN4065_c0_g1_i2.p1  ORF type:complete len:183 (+),score=39.25 TRINITY_DN4065_c0_g1_i2:212-760(+)